jgi:predicted nucleotidyltransferase
VGKLLNLHAVVPEIDQRRPQIVVLCQAHGVRRLELIGSAARGDFDPSRSDFDFLIEFVDPGWEGLSDRYFGVLFGLEDLFGRKVDLVQRSAVRNPLFLKVAERHAETIFEEGSPKAA